MYCVGLLRGLEGVPTLSKTPVYDSDSLFGGLWSPPRINIRNTGLFKRSLQSTVFLISNVDTDKMKQWLSHLFLVSRAAFIQHTSLAHAVVVV